MNARDLLDNVRVDGIPGEFLFWKGECKGCPTTWVSGSVHIDDGENIVVWRDPADEGLGAIHLAELTAMVAEHRLGHAGWRPCLLGPPA